MKKKRKAKISRNGKLLRNRRTYERRLSVIEKPNFPKLFARYLAIGLCMAMILGYVGTKIAVAYYRVVAQKEFGEITPNLGNEIVQDYTESAQIGRSQEHVMSLWKAQVRARLNGQRACGYESCLYEISTKERFVEQKSVVNISIFEEQNGENPVFRVFECEWNVMQEALSDYKKLYKECGPEVGIDELPYLVLKDAYIKGGEFVPGEVRLVMGDRGTKVIKKYDYTPDDKTGYQYVEYSDNELTGSVGWFIEPTDDVEYELIDTYMKNEGDEENKWNYDSGVLTEMWTTFWGIQMFHTESVSIDNGEKYMLVWARDANLWDTYGVFILVAYGVLLLLILLGALVTAYINYMKRLTYYQLDTYRRETTNAMAHDLKTPLMAISGYAENLRNNVHGEKRVHYADQIVEHVEYMNDMIENILELVKVEGVRQVSEKSLVDLKILSEAILKKYEILVTDKKLNVSVNGVCEIEAHKAGMEQVLENLIGNAIKYAPADTEIHIQMNETVYEIRNKMCGELQMPVEQLLKPFVKGDNSRNEQRGTGIGLTIVKNIVDMHEFELTLQCEEQEFVVGIWF